MKIWPNCPIQRWLKADRICQGFNTGTKTSADKEKRSRAEFFKSNSTPQNALKFNKSVDKAKYAHYNSKSAVCNRC